MTKQDGLVVRKKWIVAIMSVLLLLSLSGWLVLTYLGVPAREMELEVWTGQKMGTVNQLVGVNSYGPDVTGLYQDPVAYELFQTLGLQRLRIWCRFGQQLAESTGWGWHHNIFNGTSLVDAQNPQYYNWTYLDLLLDVVNKTGAQPILTFTGCPRTLALDGAPNNPPINLNVYAEVVAHIIMHYEQGWPGNTGQIFDLDYIEIGNEPNLAAFWNGSMQEFLDLYMVVSQRLSQLDATFQIGGPGLADIALSQWTTNFLSTVTANTLPLDFFSWHAYWDDATQVVNVIDAVTHLLHTHGYSHIDCVFDEYGRSLQSDAEWDTMSVAVHLTEVLSGATQQDIDIACFAFAKDVPLHPSVPGPFGDEANFGLLTRQPTTPKPTYHALKPFAAIRGHSILNATLIAAPTLIPLAAPLTYLVTRSPGDHNYTLLITNHGISAITVQLILHNAPTGAYHITTRELSPSARSHHNHWSPPCYDTATDISVISQSHSILWLIIQSENPHSTLRSAPPFTPLRSCAFR